MKLGWRDFFLYTVLIEEFEKSYEYENGIEQEIAALKNALHIPVWHEFTKAHAQEIVTYYENQDPE